MLLIRCFEDKVQQLFMQGLVPGTTHLCQGQEAVSVGAISAITSADYLTITYRGHGQALARGIDPEGAFAELMGRETGLCKGRGAGLPVALGAAMSAKLRGTSSVALTFFGDGATNIGTFHEALNMASVWKAPVVFICENNLYGEYSPIRTTTPVDNLAIRATAYAMPGVTVDGNDVDAVYNATRTAVERARAGEGPTLLECKTYRYSGHSRTDPAKYRKPGELEAWKSRDPILRLGEALASEDIMSIAEQDAMRHEVQDLINAAAERAAAAPWPKREEIDSYVYAE
jgi:pyruvate dehydrogenase E1 component alpha subunit